ncbi:MAG: hypothetical protein MJZ37_04685 [Bacilli bacterium]|nr:hypothetical protein [Bacilli bacterium]
MKKNKILLAMITTTLCGCSVVQPEPEAPDYGDGLPEKPHKVVIGLTEYYAPTPIPAHIEHEDYTETNPALSNCTYFGLYCPLFGETDGTKYLITTKQESDFLDFKVETYGNIFESEASGTIILDTILDMPIYKNERIDLYYIVFDLDTKTITTELMAPLQLSQGSIETGISFDDTYHKKQETECITFEKHSILTMKYNYIDRIDKSYKIFEYNINDELIKTSNGDFEDSSFTLDANTEYYIIETTSKKYEFASSMSSNVRVKDENYKTRELHNHDEGKISIDFYPDPDDEFIKKVSLWIDTDSEN